MGEVQVVEGLSKKEKEFMDTDNRVGIAVGRRVSGGGRGYKGINSNGKKSHKK